MIKSVNHRPPKRDFTPWQASGKHSTPPRPIILASASVGRANVLARTGLDFQIIPANIDENQIKSNYPDQIAKELAITKALVISNKYKKAMVIGADQTLEINNQRIDKSTTINQARKKLKMMRNQTHMLHSAVACAINNQQIWAEVITCKITMRSFNDDELEQYLSRNPQAAIESVGGYMYEGEAIHLLSSSTGSDSEIIGMPLFGVLEQLRQWNCT